MAFLGSPWISPIEIPDPGAGGRIYTEYSGYMNIRSAAVETRTLAPPVFLGQMLQINFIEDNGTVRILLDQAAMIQPISSGAGFNLFNVGSLLLLLAIPYRSDSVFRWFRMINGVTITS